MVTTKEAEKTIKKKLRLKMEINKFVEQNALRLFLPNGSQKEFIDSIGSGEYFIGIFSAANGCGKTALMANILGNFIFKSGNEYFQDLPLFKNFPFVHRGRIVSSSKNIEEIGAIQTEIKKWFPKGKYTTGKQGKRFDSEYVVGDWVIDVMSYDQEVEQFESATLSFICFDEPPPLRILHASIARLRRGGIILIFMTPLDTGGEIIEDLTGKDELVYEGEVIGKVYCQFSDVEQNCKQHGINGRLEHKDIVQMMSFYDPEEREAREKGKPTHLIGRIYPDFDNKDPYVVDDFMIPDSWTRINILDPHDGIPYALSWVAIDPAGQMWVYDEFPFEDLEKINTTSLTIPDYARIVREKEGRDVLKLRIIDPFFGNKRYGNTGKTVKQELGDVGLDYEDGDTSGLDTGHKKLREFMKYQKAWPVSGTNHPKLHVFKSCRNHWRSLLRYKRKIHKSGEVKDKIVIDETYKHFCDNLRHLAMRPDFINLIKKSQNESGTKSYRVIGPMKDIHFEVDDDDETNYGRYRQMTQGAMV